HSDGGPSRRGDRDHRRRARPARESSAGLNGAIIGFGETAQYGHWPAYAASNDLSIIAVVERTAERRQIAESLPSSPRAYESLDALAATEPIDFIDIRTPPALHADPMIASLARGWH